MSADSSHVELSVRAGRILVSGAGEPAVLELPSPLQARIDGEEPRSGRIMVPAGAHVDIEGLITPAETEYVVDVSQDAMRARLRLRQRRGYERELHDQGPARHLTLTVAERQLEPPAPDMARALAALNEASVSAGIDERAIENALVEPGADVVVAEGLEPRPGRNGYVQALIDFEAVQFSGVPEGTPLLRCVPRRDGEPGFDVHGRTLEVRPVRDARLSLGAGVAIEQGDSIVLATCDGLPRWDGDRRVEVLDELVLDSVGPTSGDIDFCGSVRVTGDVGAGRSVRARRRLTVEGNVDRARLESGSRLEVRGTIMSSQLRAGGRRAVAAGIHDRLVELPAKLADAATRARELRDAAEARGQEISHGLSLQLILERIHRPIIVRLDEIATELAEAGPEAEDEAKLVREWHRLLTTAAVNSLGAEAFMRLLDELSRMVADVQAAVSDGSDLVVTYMQASEAEATGTVTLAGKGIYNSRIVAWGGLAADHPEAVVRGGSLECHGSVSIVELGSPSGARMQVVLGAGASLTAERVYSGTVVSGPAHAHRFISDRSAVRIQIDDAEMDVSSLAA